MSPSLVILAIQFLVTQTLYSRGSCFQILLQALFFHTLMSPSFHQGSYRFAALCGFREMGKVKGVSIEGLPGRALLRFWPSRPSIHLTTLTAPPAALAQDEGADMAFECRKTPVTHLPLEGWARLWQSPKVKVPHLKFTKNPQCLKRFLLSEKIA